MYGFMFVPSTACCREKKYWHFVKHVADTDFVLPSKCNFIDLISLNKKRHDLLEPLVKTVGPL